MDLLNSPNDSLYANINKYMNTIKTLEDLRRELSPIQNTNEVHRLHLTKTDRLALFITSHIGTMGFFYCCLILVTAPFFIPTLLPLIQYISSGFLQLIFLPLIMVGQNLQGRHSELRAQHTYETNIKSEKEIEAILLHLEKQDATMLEILQRIEKIERGK